ncbi:M48 family metallopeptidase [Bacteroidota bacterium]
MPFSEITIEHKDFGKINIVKSTRASRISLSMKPFEPLKLTVPVLMSSKRTEEFLQKKEKWILKNLEKIRKLEGQYTLFTEETKFNTKEHQLLLSRYEKDVPRVSLRDKLILVQLPEQTDVKESQVQEMIRGGIQAAWRKEAKKYLPERLGELSQKHKLPFAKVVIKNNRSRWGSCSQKNNINLSLHMMRLPDHLIDYILVHELVHTIHKNHSKKFWVELEEKFPGARMADRELRAYRIDIY